MVFKSLPISHYNLHDHVYIIFDHDHQDREIGTPTGSLYSN